MPNQKELSRSCFPRLAVVLAFAAGLSGACLPPENETSAWATATMKDTEQIIAGSRAARETAAVTFGELKETLAEIR